MRIVGFVSPSENLVLQSQFKQHHQHISTTTHPCAEFAFPFPGFQNQLSIQKVRTIGGCNMKGGSTPLKTDMTLENYHVQQDIYLQMVEFRLLF